MNFDVSHLESHVSNDPSTLLHHHPLKRAYQDLDLPIIKYLASQNMPPNPPNTGIPLLRKPLVTQRLRVKVMDLKATMMNMRMRDRAIWRQRRQENAMVVDVVLPTI